MGGEARAAHAGDARLPDDVHDLLGGEGLVIVGMRGQLGGKGVLPVVVDDHGHDLAAAGMRPGLHRRHRAGDAGMDGGAQARGLGDLLSRRHLIPLLHDGLAGGAHMHGHGEHHLGRRHRDGDQGLPLGGGLVLGGMDPAEERMTHRHTSSQTLVRSFRTSFFLTGEKYSLLL